MDLTKNNSNDILSIINNAFNKIYPLKKYGSHYCNTNKKGEPFRAFCFDSKNFIYGIEYASNAAEAEKGCFEDGNLFCIYDYETIDCMIEDMQLEIDG